MKSKERKARKMKLILRITSNKKISFATVVMLNFTITTIIFMVQIRNNKKT